MNEDSNEIQKKKAGFDASLIFIILAVVIFFGIVSPEYTGITIFMGLCIYLIFQKSDKKKLVEKARAKTHELHRQAETVE